jgi:glycosyltransferase involved in cell wall biosynthesis
MAVLHLAEPSGPFRDLELHLEWIAAAGALEVVVPGPGRVADAFSDRALVTELSYEALTAPGAVGAAARLPARLRREVRAFRRRIRAAAPELVVVATTSLPAALLAARLERVPTLVYAAEVLTGPAGARTRRGSLAGRSLVSLTGSLASAVIACSETVGHQFRGVEVVVAYPPIEDAFSGGDAEAFRSRLGLDAGAPCVVTVGNITRGRGQDVAVDAMPTVRAAFPDARGVVVGGPFPRRKDEAFRDELSSLVRAKGLAEAIVFAGYWDRLADAYAAADVVVNPVRVPESFGRASCEALVAGRPVVASRIGAVPEVLRDGETALLVPPDDPGALGAAIVRLLGDRELATTLAAAGRREVLERFAPGRSGERFKAVVERLTRRSRAPVARGRARA